MDQDEEFEFTAKPRPKGGARHAAPKRTTYIRRRIVAGVFVACAVFIAAVGVSLGGALLNPANGS